MAQKVDFSSATSQHQLDSVLAACKTAFYSKVRAGDVLVAPAGFLALTSCAGAAAAVGLRWGARDVDSAPLTSQVSAAIASLQESFPERQADVVGFLGHVF
eukprot:3825940-Alexandrium_andersonii.AAC.1